VDVVASLSQGRTAAAQCGLFTYKSVPVLFEPPCTYYDSYSITHSVSTAMANWLREQFCNLVYFTDFSVQ